VYRERGNFWKARAKFVTSSNELSILVTECYLHASLISVGFSCSYVRMFLPWVVTPCVHDDGDSIFSETLSHTYESARRNTP
jgi:hypothetical protein